MNATRYSLAKHNCSYFLDAAWFAKPWPWHSLLHRYGIQGVGMHAHATVHVARPAHEDLMKTEYSHSQKRLWLSESQQMQPLCTAVLCLYNDMPGLVLVWTVLVARFYLWKTLNKHYVKPPAWPDLYLLRNESPSDALLDTDLVLICLV